jgi:hypothetical protein
MMMNVSIAWVKKKVGFIKAYRDSFHERRNDGKRANC